MRSMLKLSAVLIALGVLLSGQSARACHGLFRCLRCSKCYYGYGYPAVVYVASPACQSVCDDTRKPEPRAAERARRPETHPVAGEKLTQLELIMARQTLMDAELKALDKKLDAKVDELKKLIEDRLPPKPPAPGPGAGHS